MSTRELSSGSAERHLAALLESTFCAALSTAEERVRAKVAAATLARLRPADAAAEKITKRDPHAPRAARAPQSWTILAVGKAGVTMMRGAARALTSHGAAVGESLVVVPDGVTIPRGPYFVNALHASHPLPDARSVMAGERALSLLQRAGEARGNVLVLISGGASALMSKPVSGLTLVRKRAVVDALLRGGAPIDEINVVRRHLSAVKGGALLRAAFGARVVTLLVSDVLSDSPWDIGSGPTSVDPTTKRDAARVLRRIGRAEDVAHLVETLKARELERAPTPFRKEDTEIIASPSWFAGEVQRVLLREGFSARELPPSDADSEHLAAEYVQYASKMKPGAAFVRAAEPTVHVAARGTKRAALGRGGRSTHVAALLAKRLPPEVVFLAGATDGVDGSSGTAGACVFRAAFERVSEDAVRDALSRFDTGPLHRHAKTALVFDKPTGVNFADVHVLARVRE